MLTVQQFLMLLREIVESDRYSNVLQENAYFVFHGIRKQFFGV
ncbi:hypothetical protein [Myxosarcina sp. GI1(2024)]